MVGGEAPGLVREFALDTPPWHGKKGKRMSHFGSHRSEKPRSRLWVVSLWAVAVLFAPSCESHSPPGDWVQGLPDPDALQAVWVFRTQDCLSCQSYDYLIRRAQQRSLGRLAVSAIHVGWEADSLIPRSLFDHARIAAEIVHLPPRDYEELWPGRDPPNLFLVHNGRVVWDLEEEVARGRAADSTFLRAVSERVGGSNPE